MYELIVIWDDNSKDTHGGYLDYEDARKAGDGMLTAFGKQIQWTGVRKDCNSPYTIQLREEIIK